MENHIEETNRDVHGINDLPENKKKETEEILADIKKEEDAKAAETKKDGETQKSKEDLDKEAADKKAADDKIEADKKTELEKGEKKPRRESKLVPSYLLGIEKTNFEKREKELLTEIENLKKGAKSEDGGEEKKEIPKVDIKALVDKIVADNKVEDPKVIQDIFTAVDAYVKDKTQMPADLVEKLKIVDDLKSQAEIAVEEANFSADFDKQIIPLIKAEYGDDVPVEKIAEIKEKLKTIAYTPDYAKISYDEIYNGKKDFRGLHTPKKRSAEGGRDGAVDLTKSDESYSEELSDEEVSKLSPEAFEKYGNAMAKKERNRG